jgi:glutaredoxin-related protein
VGPFNLLSPKQYVKKYEMGINNRLYPLIIPSVIQNPRCKFVSHIKKLNPNMEDILLIMRKEHLGHLLKRFRNFLTIPSLYTIIQYKNTPIITSLAALGWLKA